MPTGYTAGILNGKTKTFTEFAKICMRAFGATIHMRDDSLSKEYTPVIPSSYYGDLVKETTKKIENYKTMSDSKLLKLLKKENDNSIKYHEDKIVEINKNLKKLNELKKDAIEWQPPTSEHENFKAFMLEQLETTIKHDGSTAYHERELEKLKAPCDLGQYRSELIESAESSLAYYKEEQEKENKRCEASNNWVKILIESL